MEKYLHENLLDGEEILWSGRSEPFRLLTAPYSHSLPFLWTASICILIIFSFLFIPFAVQFRFSAIQIAFWIAFIMLIPLSLCVRSIADKKLIEKRIRYVITNYRAITLTDKDILSMLISSSTPYRLEKLPDGNEILYIGDACDTKSYSSRSNTVTGIRRNNKDTNQITGLIFYGIRNAQDICRKYTPFAEYPMN